MIIFILCNLLLALLVKTGNSYLPLLSTPVALGLCIAAMIMIMLLGYLKKISTMNWHDGFATLGLLIWFGWWKPQFNDDTPMFFVFPIYYALLTSLVTLALISKSQNFDADSVHYLRYLEKLTRFDMNLVMGMVLVSLLITRHYALYPMTMTYFVLRHTMIVCLEAVNRP